MSERFVYFEKRILAEYPHSLFQYGPTHRKHPDKPYSLCGVHAYRGEGGAMRSKSENMDDELVTCVGCRTILGLDQ
jgi:hypothetical protein